MPQTSKQIHVVCLVMLNDQHEIFSAKRSSNQSLADLWEFPGGKIEAGESPEHALAREIREELDLSIGELTELTPVRHEYEFVTVRLAPFLWCTEDQVVRTTLREHADAIWIPVPEALNLDWAQADIPIVKEVQSLFTL